MPELSRPTRPLPFEGVPAPAIHLALGVVFALALHFFTCGIFPMGTHLFFHECGGHTVAAWLMGAPAIPAIWLTHVYDQQRALAVLIWLGLGAAAYRFREQKPVLAAFAGAAAVYPLVAFTRAWEILELSAGHLGEIGWAAFCFYRATRGGFFHTAERPLYAALGWSLAVGNVVLFFRLATDAAQRGLYESVALTDVGNDFVRVSEQTGWTLAHVAAVMLVLSLLIPVAGAALGWWRWSVEGEIED